MAIGRITGQMLSSTLNRDTTDLKIASTGESNLFVVDATNDRIGIGVASPTVQFQTSGSATIGTDLTVTGNLVVNGSTTTINTTNLTVDDKNIELAHSLSGASPTDAAADGGGIILKGDSDHTILWSNSQDSWDFSEHVNIASTKAYRINNSAVLDANNLNLENISINGNVITSSSNADINITPSGTGKVVVEGINIQGTVITGNDSTVISFGGNKLSGVADPSGATDVATKNYVDNNAGGTLNLGDSSSNAGAVDLTNDIALEFRSGDSITATVAGNGVTFDLNETISVDQINAGDSSAITVASPLQTIGTLTIKEDATVVDSKKIYFGTDQDAYLEYNGTNLNFIQTTNGGEMFIRHPRQVRLDGSGDNGTSIHVQGVSNKIDFFAGNSGSAVMSAVAGAVEIDDLRTNVISSDDSTAVTINDGLQINGNLGFNEGVVVSTILDEDNLSSNSATALATQQSIKAYVDSVAGGTLAIGDNASNAGSVNLPGNEQLVFNGNDSITATVSGNTVTFDLDETISVDQINAGDSSLITIGSATKFNSSLAFNGDGTVNVTSIKDEDDMTSNSATALATQQSIKAYVDTEIAGLSQTVKISDNASTVLTLDLKNDTLKLNGGDSLTTTISGDTVTFDLDETISVDQINAGDSSTITLGAAVEGSTLNMNTINVDQINARDSSAVSFGNSIIVDAISSGDSSFVRINDSLETEAAQINQSLTVDGNAQIMGNLTVQGTTTYINTTNTKVADPLLLLNNGNSGGSDIDAGIMVERGSAGNNAVFYWNEGDDRWKAVTSTSAENATAVTDTAYATINQGGLVFAAESVVVTSIKDEDNMASNSATALATQQSIKAYVDSVAGGTIKLGDDASNAGAVDINGNEELMFHNGDSITPVVSANGVTFNLNETITVDQINAGDSSVITFGSPVIATTFTSTGTLTAVTGDFQTVKTNVIESDDSTAVRINDSLNVDGGVDVGASLTISNGQSVNAILDEDNMASDSANALATQQSIKAYVDSVAGGSLAIGDSASNAGSVNLPANEQLIFNGNDSITATVSGNTVTFDLNETITVDQINAGDSSSITLGAAIEGTTAGFNSIFVDAINVRGSTALSINDGLEVNGGVNANSIAVDEISARDSSTIRFESAVEFTNEVRAGGLLIENSRITPTDSSNVDFDGNILSGVSTPTENNHAANKAYVDDQVVTEINGLTDVDAPAADVQAGDLLAGASDDSTGGNFTLTSQMNSGILIPSGTTAQRPGIYAGVIRYNSETGKYEGSTDLSTWNSFAMEGHAETINKDVFTGDGSTATFTFSNVSNATAGSGNNGANGLIVYIDNVLQEPTQNYTVTNTTITLDSAPHASARIVVLQGFDGGAGGGTAGGLTTVTNTDVDSAVEGLDSWAMATYRAAKYTYRIENANGEHQAGEILVVHNGSAAFFTEYAKVLTGNNDLITFTVGVGSGNVNLFGSANTPNSNFRAKRINLEVA